MRRWPLVSTPRKRKAQKERDPADRADRKHLGLPPGKARPRRTHDYRAPQRRRQRATT